MAKFKIKHGGYNQYETTLYVNQISQSVDKNISTLQYRLVTVFSGESGAWNNDLSTRVIVTINGTNLLNNLQTYDFRRSKTKTWGSGTITVPHNSDGTKSVGVSFSINSDNSYFGNPSSSRSMSLTTILRATTPTLLADSVTMGSSLTITLPRASDKFTHEIYYKYGNGSLQLIAAGVGTSYKWDIPLSLSNNITNSTSGTFIIQVNTVNDSEFIGKKTINVKLTVPQTVVPFVSIEIDGIDLINNQYIQTYSSAKINLSDTGVYGSTIKSRTTSIIHKNKIIQSSNLKSFTTVILSNSGDYIVKSSVTDSRGRTSTKTTTINVLEYAPPKLINPKIYRSTNTGVVKDDGEFGTIGGTTTFTNFSGNTLTFKAEYRQEGTPTWVNVFNLTNITESLKSNTKTVSASLESEWEVKLSLKDKVSEIQEYTYKIYSDEVTLDFHNSGTGIGVGEVSTKTYTLSLNDKWVFLGGSLKNIEDSENLNDIVNTGNYIQNWNNNATSQKNYPFKSAGMLEVMANKDKTIVFQRYTDVLSVNIAIRSRYDRNWNEWEFVRGVKTLSSNDYDIKNNSISINNLVIINSPNLMSITFQCKPTSRGWTQVLGIKDIRLRPKATIYAGITVSNGNTDDMGKVECYIENDGIVRVLARSVPTTAVYCTIQYPI